MKLARESVSSRPKRSASLEKPHESLPSAVPCGPRRKKNDRGQTSAFPSETSRFTPLILAQRGSALPWLVDDRAALRLRRIWCVPTRWSTTRLSAIVLPASRVPPPPWRAPNWSSDEAHTWEHHPQQPNIPPPRLNRQVESRRQPVGCISRGWARPYTRRKDLPTLIPRNQVSGGEGTRMDCSGEGRQTGNRSTVLFDFEHFSPRRKRANEQSDTLLMPWPCGRRRLFVLTPVDPTASKIPTRDAPPCGC